MNYPQALEALERRQETKIELGLDRVRRHLARLKNPHKGLSCIHVAGTNGKGSVCAILDSVLRKAGYKTGFYYSPHLFDVRERIRINGRWIARADFARLMVRTLQTDPGNRLTYFELLTSVAFQWFKENSVDVAILETGLGGRLDATNVIDKPLASAIASIALDHTQFLGSTLSAIAREKAGIIKPGRPVFCPNLDTAALRVIAGRARALRSPLMIVPQSYETIDMDWRSNLQILRDSQGVLFPLSLLGGCQASNVSLVRSILDRLRGRFKVSEAAWKAGLASLHWPGRFEVREVGRKIAVLDGAHNPEAMRQFAETWKSSPWSGGRTRWILGIMKDKDVKGLLKPLAAHCRDVVAVEPLSPRALNAAELARQIRRLAPRSRVIVGGKPEDAIAAWRKQRGGPQTAVICGSFYLVGRAARLL
ncbi:MAG: hypothetical protein A3J74_02450 [Elusimicrobia bacterium RIFCSPHIGHO2_02_FULL_57_9]|nr:MAG: hypothetical protein A3J74_02450 [Elusimicrobia bacterium RIFCSPHIGHO2_02_FULL_57_9]